MSLFVRDAQRVAYGILRWTPDVFWRATPLDLSAASAALQHVLGAGEDDVMQSLKQILDHALKEQSHGL